MAVILLLLALQSFPRVARTGTLHSPRVTESSGVAASRAHPGVLWTHNDSGDDAYVYATDLAGADRGLVRIRGARAVDWEDIALGPCPTRRGACLYIADTGDKREDPPIRSHLRRCRAGCARQGEVSGSLRSGRGAAPHVPRRAGRTYTEIYTFVSGEGGV